MSRLNALRLPADVRCGAVPFTGPFVEDIDIVDTMFLTDIQALFIDEVTDPLGLDHPDTDDERDKLYGGESVEFCHGPIVLQSGSTFSLHPV